MECTCFFLFFFVLQLESKRCSFVVDASPFVVIIFELELERIQTQMTQKPMLRVEMGKGACVGSSLSVNEQACTFSLL
jgi:hypothetical protein